MKIPKTRGWLVWALLPFLLGVTPARAADDSDQLWKEGKIKKRPKPLKQPAPEYPANLSRLGLTGKVTLDFIIDKEGNVQNPVVVESNNPWFERPAIIAILKWKFTPAEIDGRKVNIRGRQQIVFDLWGGGQSPWELSNTRAKKSLPPEMQWDVAPVPVNTAYPVYPFEALQAGRGGKTRVIYVINEKGNVSEARLLEASSPDLGQAVLAMVNTWRFTPARKKNGTPIATAMGMEQEFSADGDGDVPVSEEAKHILRDLKKKPESIANAGELDQPLKPLSRRPPAYPLALQMAGQPGEATVEFFVDKNGDAQLPRVVSSSAPEFGYAAAQAVATWRFEEPKKGGKSVVVRARVPVGFALKEPKPDDRK